MLFLNLNNSRCAVHTSLPWVPSTRTLKTVSRPPTVAEDHPNFELRKSNVDCGAELGAREVRRMTTYLV
jgi:hypothetical protein